MFKVQIQSLAKLRTWLERANNFSSPFLHSSSPVSDQIVKVIRARLLNDILLQSMTSVWIGAVFRVVHVSTYRCNCNAYSRTHAYEISPRVWLRVSDSLENEVWTNCRVRGPLVHTHARADTHTNCMHTYTHAHTHARTHTWSAAVCLCDYC